MSEPSRNAELRKFFDLKEEAAKLDRAAKDAKAARDEQMRTVHEMLTKEGTKGATTVDLGPGYGTVRFSPRKTVYGDVYDEKKFVAWVEENGKGEELFFPDKLRMKPVNEMAREILDHEDAKFPPGLGPREQLGVTVTKLKG